MSHFATVKSDLRDATALKAALKKVLGNDIKIEEYAEGALVRNDYQSNSQLKANTIVRKESLGVKSDIGFLKVVEGNKTRYEAIIDGYGWSSSSQMSQFTSVQDFLNKVQVAHEISLVESLSGGVYAQEYVKTGAEEVVIRLRRI